MAYFIVAMSTSRTRVRPVAGSISVSNGMGTKWPACIEIITPLPPESRYLAAQYPRSRPYSMSKGIGSAQRSS